MILGDSPIYDVKDDKLGRNNFATKIAEMIVSYSATNESGIVLGLEGDWGSGKTSIINLIKSKIENRKDLHVAYLNSWLAADKDTLVIEFFKGISEIVAIGNKHPLDYTDIEGYASNFINKASRGITINMPFKVVHLSRQKIRYFLMNFMLLHNQLTRLDNTSQPAYDGGWKNGFVQNCKCGYSA